MFQLLIERTNLIEAAYAKRIDHYVLSIEKKHSRLGLLAGILIGIIYNLLSTLFVLLVDTFAISVAIFLYGVIPATLLLFFVSFEASVTQTLLVSGVDWYAQNHAYAFLRFLQPLTGVCFLAAVHGILPIILFITPYIACCIVVSIRYRKAIFAS